MSAPDELEVHSTDLQKISSTLDTAGGDLFGHASALDGAPDAGASSGEVSKAMVSLASAVAAFADHLGELASTTSTTDRDFNGAVRQRQGELGP